MDFPNQRDESGRPPDSVLLYVAGAFHVRRRAGPARPDLVYKEAHIPLSNLLPGMLSGRW